MNSCPRCHRTYDDESMRFCLDDGTPLMPATIVTDPEATLVLPETSRGSGPTVSSPQTPTFTERPAHTQVDQHPITPVTYGSEPKQRSVLPWILGIVVVLGLSAVGVAYFVTRALSGGGSSEQALTSESSPTPIATPTASSNSTPYSSSPTPATISEPPPVQEKRAESKPSPTEKTAPPAATEHPPDKEPARPQGPMSGGVMNGKAVHLVQPAYPAIAKAAHASGTVVVQVLIDENGNVTSAQAISGHPLLQAAAVAAARASKFTPTKLSGQPVKVSGVIQYNFVAQ